MYAAFAIGQKWDAAVLLDTDAEGKLAAKKINEQSLSKLASEEQNRFRILMLGEAVGISKTDAGIEDIFPDAFYLKCVNAAYGVAITMDELPKDGSDMITKRVEQVLFSKHSMGLDKIKVLETLMNELDKWKDVAELPEGTLEKASTLFMKVNRAFDT
jgi:hypothetical protein